MCHILDRETGITVTKGMVTMGKLEGKVAFITGAARGQGRSHAIRLAQEGADIIAVDITEQVATVPYATAGPGDMEQTVKEVEALDRRIIASEADVRDLAALRKAADDGVAALGRLDIVLANAGISTMSPTIEMEEEMWDTMIDINLTGVWKTVRQRSRTSWPAGAAVRWYSPVRSPRSSPTRTSDTIRQPNTG